MSEPLSDVEQIRRTATQCRRCLVVLTEFNWRPCHRRINARICRDCDRQASRDYYRANRIRLMGEVQKWAKRNPERRRAIAGRSKQKLRDQTLLAYGSKCACCGEGTPEFLAVDHIGGGGNAHRRATFGKTTGTGDAFYRWLRNAGFPKDKFRLLCHNCNCAIGWYGRCPHETR